MNKKCLTPKELMISRYEAFINKDWNYLEETSVYQKKEEFNDLDSIKWLKLEVVKAYENIVEFKAYYKENGKVNVLHEKSKFIQKDGLWKYLDGDFVKAGLGKTLVLKHNNKL
jgi:SEC-C motif-containing protein